jgi:hypothetical protein
VGWSHSFYKRLWAMMREKKRNKERMLKQKQKEHVIYKASH